MYGHLPGAADARENVARRLCALENMVGASFQNYYSGRRVLVTGHTGFKGGWLSLWLKHLGAEVWGYSLPAPTEPNLHEIIRPFAFARTFIGDIRDSNALEAAVRAAEPDLIFH